MTARLHPELPDALLSALPIWRREQALHHRRLLADGVGSVITEAVRRLPMAATWEPEGGLFWRCEAHVPESVDPQLPEAFFWARQLQEVELTGALSRAGLPLRASRPGVVDAIALRKGSWMKMQSAGWVALIGLTGSPWPASWGGQLGAGLTLLPPGKTLEVAVLTRHVEALVLRLPLEPA